MKYLSRRVGLGAAGTVAALLVGTATVPATASPASSKGTPPGATIGQYSQALAPAVTGVPRQRADAKAAAAAKFYQQSQAAWKAQASGTKTPMACIPSCPTPSAPVAKTLPVPYMQQATENWCGPTTLAMISAYKGVAFAGSTEYDKELAAAKLVTDPDTGSTWDARSTDWYGKDSVPSGSWSSYYPMQDALNYKTYNLDHSGWYAPVALPGNPTSDQQSAFRAALVGDVYNWWPIAANQDSVTNYNIGFQPNQPWQHWWAAIGYSNSGNTTLFNDPASWSQRRTSSAPTTGGQHTVVEALGGRGYVA